MSSSFDYLVKYFSDNFEPKSGDWYQKALMKRALDEIHSANHDLQDKINRHPGVRSVIKDMQDHNEKGGD